MTAGIIAILAALIPFGIWMAHRWIAKKDANEPQARHDAAADAIVAHDRPAVNTGLSDRLDALHRLRNKDGGNPGGSGGNPNASR